MRFSMSSIRRAAAIFAAVLSAVAFFEALRPADIALETPENAANAVRADNPIAVNMPGKTTRDGIAPATVPAKIMPEFNTIILEE
jgi:hypothetical protein